MALRYPPFSIPSIHDHFTYFHLTQPFIPRPRLHYKIVYTARYTGSWAGISTCHFQLMVWVRIWVHLLCINYERSSSQWASRLTVAIVDCTPTTFLPSCIFPST